MIENGKKYLFLSDIDFSEFAPPDEFSFISEYGGIKWDVQNYNGGWGYGGIPQTEEEFLSRLKGCMDVFLDHPRICGLCYTQLTDIEQEQNGLYTYDRTPKFDTAKIHAIFARKAAIEE